MHTRQPPPECGNNFTYPISNSDRQARLDAPTWQTLQAMGLMSRKWYANKAGSGHVVLRADLGGRKVNLARAVLGQQDTRRGRVRHINGDPFDLRQANLRWLPPVKGRAQ